MGVRRITATFDIVTPMFLGGVEHEATRIRGTAVKGALAFWWRALNFARFVEDAGGNANDALNTMRERERELFGSSNAGQGAFLLRVGHSGTLQTLAKGNILSANGEEIGAQKVNLNHPPREARGTVGVGARYLGYGVIEAFTSREDTNGSWARHNIKAYGGQLTRSCFAAGQRFSIELIFRPNAHVADMQEIIEALKLLGLLGGLGARVRRGWGSVALVSLTAENVPAGVDASWQVPASREDYIARLQGLFEHHPSRKRAGAMWPLTAFAEESRIWIADGEAGFGLDMLDRLGRAMLNYRAMGRGGAQAVGGQAIQRQFAGDHDWFRQGDNRVDIPYRSAFGLPHMYDSQRGEGVTVAGEEWDRRASPLMLHVHESGHAAVGVVTLMPTAFLGDGMQIQATRRNGAPQQTRRVYNLGDPYGARNASGLDVLQDFVGAGPGRFTANQVMNFTQVLP